MTKNNNGVIFFQVPSIWVQTSRYGDLNFQTGLIENLKIEVSPWLYSIALWIFFGKTLQCGKKGKRSFIVYFWQCIILIYNENNMVAVGGFRDFLEFDFQANSIFEAHVLICCDKTIVKRKLETFNSIEIGIINHFRKVVYLP